MSGNSRRSVRIQNREQIAHSTVTPKNLEDTNNIEQKNSFQCNSIFEDELDGIEKNTEKPTELFLQNDVDGKNIYPVIGTPIKKNAMIKKVISSRDSHVNSISPIKKDIRICLTKISTNKELMESWNVKYNTVNSKNDYKNVANESEHNLSEVSDDSQHSSVISSENSEHENSDYDDKENKTIKTKIISEKKQDVKLPLTLRKNKLRNVKDYYLKADEYFAIHSEKSVTSNHTLSRLKNQHLDEDKLQKLLINNNHISKTHQKQLHIMIEILQKRYIEWLHIMEEGFTVLLYGLGSKRLLINNFHKQMIPDEPTLIINGFFPSLTLKEILDNIIVELLGLETVTNQSECFNIIEKTMKTHPNDRLYLLIHNIDGGMLRSNKTQDILSRLASISNIHVLASVDHINAPLIWDNVKRVRYNFYWMNATTFLPYDAETSYESSLLIQKSGALALLSLQNVFASLTSNAKAIYIILVKYQLENSGNNYAGMAFKDLYRASREGFLVSSDQALRAQLTEFIDHKLVKIKRNVDGVEYLIIPLDDTLLKQFIEQQNELF